jgi:hypothetical protein
MRKSISVEAAQVAHKKREGKKKKKPTWLQDILYRW